MKTFPLEAQPARRTESYPAEGCVELVGRRKLHSSPAAAARRTRGSLAAAARRLYRARIRIWLSSLGAQAN